MLRFSSVSVPFASRTITLTAGQPVTDDLLSVLKAASAEKGEVAVVCADRPTLISATKAFRSTLPVPAPRQAGKPASTPVTGRAPSLLERIEALEEANQRLLAEVASLKADLATKAVARKRASVK